jgi:transcriptional regulator with XRE-family HTH domain
MKKDLPKTLAGRVQHLREVLDISSERLAELTNVDLSTINGIEEGKEIFLSTTVRQRLAKALRISSSVLKEVEKPPVNTQVPEEILEELKERILAGQLTNNRCPICHSSLNCKLVTLYDLENRPVNHPKANCSKCPFQIK